MKTDADVVFTLRSQQRGTNLPGANLNREQSDHGFAKRSTKQGLRSIKPKCDGYIAGVDEVGRGPLAGPVVAAAVILDPSKNILGLADSKVLTAKKREILAAQIQQNCLAWAVGRAEVEEIDKINILQASLLAMQRALENLSLRPAHILVDGQYCPKISFTVTSFKAIIDGDNLVPVISAASIIAKVIRDKEMVELDRIYPNYGFAQHKGYGTKQHMLALQQYGVTPIHRRSFSPVVACL